MDFTIEKITFSHYSILNKGEVFKNYSNTRGVCGIVLAVSGKAVYQFADGASRTLSAGEIALFSKECAYILNNTGGDDFAHYTVNFTLCNHSKPVAKASFFKSGNTKMHAALFKDIISYYEAGNNLRALSSLYAMLADIFENTSEQNPDKSKQSIKPAIDCITSDYSNEITLNLLAQKCMMSNTNFRRVFKAVYGVSPIEYLIKFRLDRAKQLLLHTTLTISEISQLCGFNEVSYFSRIFKNRYSKTPIEYRNKK